MFEDLEIKIVLLVVVQVNSSSYVTSSWYMYMLMLNAFTFGLFTDSIRYYIKYPMHK